MYLALAAVVVALFTDDVLRLHERGGEWAAEAWSLPAFGPLRAVDTGEVLVLAAWAVPLFAVVAVAVRGAGLRARFHTAVFVAFAAVLAGFGVAVDLVHQTFSTVWGVSFALETLEEGGELVTMTALLASAVSALRHTPRRAASAGGLGRPGGQDAPVLGPPPSVTRR